MVLFVGFMRENLPMRGFGTRVFRVMVFGVWCLKRRKPLHMNDPVKSGCSNVLHYVGAIRRLESLTDGIFENGCSGCVYGSPYCW